jgi:hypothetical protein
MGVGFTYPAEVTAASTLSDKPRSENDIKPQNLTGPVPTTAPEFEQTNFVRMGG